MSLLDKASLIVTPNSYKESKLYSVVPNTTLGDMDVVRATTATRVNSSGLIEVVPRNLLQFSEQLDNAIWTKSGVTITANSVNSPIGTLTADLVTPTISDASLRQSFLPTAVLQYNFSIWLRSSTGSNFSTTLRAWRDSPFQNISNVVINVTTEWQKFNFSFTTLDATTHVIAIGGSSTLSTGENFYSWGAQLDLGSTATEYFPTTTRLNIPRIDYTNGSCPSLLVEPQRTNLVPNPFAYSGSGVAFNSTVANSPISGGLSTRITKNEAAGTLRYASQSCSANALSALTAYTISAFFKYDGYNVQTSMEYNNANQWGGVSWSQLINIASTGITLGASSACTSTIESFFNGWYRVNIRVTTGAVILGAPPVNYLIQVASSLSTGQGFLHTAVQLEAGSYPTSYIPTVASSVTRNADVISKTGISSLINSQAGTMFIEASALANNTTARFIELNETLSSLTNNVYFRYEPLTNLVAFTVFSGSSLQCNINYSLPLTQIVNNKMAFVWALNRFEIWVNGSKVAEDTLGVPPVASSLNKILFYDRNSANYFDGKLKSLQIYKEALSNSELAQLTTL